MHSQDNFSIDDAFKTQIAEIKATGYRVLSLSQITSSLQSENHPLPAQTLGLTFDGAWRESLLKAQEILEQNQFPFTVFIDITALSHGNLEHMTWQELRELKQSNPHMTLGVLPQSSQRTDQSDAPELLNQALSLFRQYFGEAPSFVAWPDGSIPPSLTSTFKNYSFSAGFGRHAGVAYKGSDFSNLPRFSIRPDASDIDHFRLIIAAEPLPIDQVIPENSFLLTPNSPAVGFSLQQNAIDTSQLSCFIPGKGKVVPFLLNKTRIEIRLPEAFYDRYTPLNCTLPQGKETLWTGFLFIRPDIPNTGQE